MSKDIVVETTRVIGEWPKGTELGFASEAKATSTLGDGAFKVLRNQDGTIYDAPAPRTTRTDTPATAPKPQKGADALEPAKKA